MVRSSSSPSGNVIKLLRMPRVGIRPGINNPETAKKFRKRCRSSGNIPCCRKHPPFPRFTGSALCIGRRSARREEIGTVCNSTKKSHRSSSPPRTRPSDLDHSCGDSSRLSLTSDNKSSGKSRQLGRLEVFTPSTTAF